MKAHFSCVADCLPECQNMELEAESFLMRYPAAKVKKTSKDGMIHIYCDTRKPPEWLRESDSISRNYKK